MCCNICNTLINRGKILENVIRKSGKPFTVIAKEMELNRGTIYRHCEDENLSDSLLLKYGRVLKHDFSIEIPELASLINTMREPQAIYGKKTYEELMGDVEFWRSKYIDLLEKYTSMIQSQNEK